MGAGQQWSGGKAFSPREGGGQRHPPTQATPILQASVLMRLASAEGARLFRPAWLPRGCRGVRAAPSPACRTAVKIILDCLGKSCYRCFQKGHTQPGHEQRTPPGPDRNLRRHHRDDAVVDPRPWLALPQGPADALAGRDVCAPPEQGFGRPDGGVPRRHPASRRARPDGSCSRVCATPRAAVPGCPAPSGGPRTATTGRTPVFAGRGCRTRSSARRRWRWFRGSAAACSHSGRGPAVPSRAGPVCRARAARRHHRYRPKLLSAPPAARGRIAS